MAGLFQGVAQNVPTDQKVTQSTEYPKWLQDAIYNQINTATAIANTPYQDYSLPTVATASGDQTQAYADVRANQGQWQPSMDFASQGMAALAAQPGQVAAANPYYQTAAGMSGVSASQAALQQSADMLGGMNYQAAGNDLYTQQNQYMNPELANYYLQGGSNTLGAVGRMDIGAQASPFFQQQANVLSALNYNNPASNLSAGINQYISPNLANQYLQSGNVAYGQVGQMDIAAAANPYLQQQTSLLGGLNYNAPLSAMAASQNQYLNPEVANLAMQQSQKALGAAGSMDLAGAANPYIQQQLNELSGVDLNAAVSGLSSAQNQYLSPTLANQALQQAQQAYGTAQGIDIGAAANPYLQNQGAALNALNYNAAAENLQARQDQYLQPGLSNEMLQKGQAAYGTAGLMDVTEAAQPYLKEAAKTSAAGVEQYMNPYQEGVMNAIAKQGARNLSENLLPAVSDAFIRAGQFGGSRMGEFGERALRDTQESILNQQAQAIQQGYSQALSASQSDLARQAQLASTAGQLTGQQQSALTNIGQAQTAAGQAQQQVGLSAAQNVSAAQQQALSQAQQGAAQQGQMAGLAGQLAQQQQSALTNLGQAQAQFGQAQQQAGLGAAQNVSAAQQQAINQAMQRAGQYGQTASLAGQLTGQQQTALANIGQTQAQIAQAQQQAGLGAAQNLTAAQQQALTQAQQGASQYGQAAQLASQVTGQQAQSLLNLGQAQTAAGQAQQQYGLNALQNLASIQQQALGQAQQTASQYGQMGQAAGQLYGQQMSNMMDLAKTQLGAGQAQQQTGIGAAQYLANLRQQGLGQALQGASQYAGLGSTLAGVTQEQQKLLAGIGQNMSQATGADLNTRMAALNNVANLAQAQQGMLAKDAAALEAIGQSQQAVKQQELTAAYNQYMQKQLYNQQMADWMNTQIRGMAPITPSQSTQFTQGNTVQYGASPLSQIAGLYAGYKALGG